MGLIMYFPTLSASFLLFVLTLVCTLKPVWRYIQAIAGTMIQKTGQDVGKAGTDSFPLEETYTHFQLIQKNVNYSLLLCF